ncbi:hypothetical protein M2370_004388 [Bacillus sp. JUb91]|nr:hypothetical protein [Bacillus sp. JUb91]
MIGKQFTTKSNGVDRVLAMLFMGEHPHHYQLRIMYLMMKTILSHYPFIRTF